jgi:hypothetical protein
MNILQLLKHRRIVAAPGKAEPVPLHEILPEKESVGIIETQVPQILAAGPPHAAVRKGMSSVFSTLISGAVMTPLETFAITMVMGILQLTVKNPNSKAALQSQLIGLADLIYSEYGYTVPAAPVAASPVTPTGAD